VETDTAFVWADSVVELNTISQVGLNFTFIIHPCYTECENTVGLYQSFDDFGLFKFWVLVVDIFDRE
jgi:hypothetical protein